MTKKHTGLLLAGIAAGAVNGLLGAGGGMVLIPLLSTCSDLDDNEIFPTSVSIILPICIVSLCFSLPGNTLTFQTCLPYLIGSAFGGVLSGLVGRKIPTKWLHKILGILILWGGFRYLC